VSSFFDLRFFWEVVQRIGSVGQAIPFGVAIVLVVALLWLAMRFSGRSCGSCATAGSSC